MSDRPSGIGHRASGIGHHRRDWEDVEFGRPVESAGRLVTLSARASAPVSRRIYVLSGHMRFVLGDKDWVLGPREVASLDTNVPHWFGSTGEEPAEIHSISDVPANV